MKEFRREKTRYQKRDFGSKRSFGDKPVSRFGSRDSDRPQRSFNREMHTISCDKCGKACDVPFKPSGNKPVYCRECFRGNDDRAPRDRSERSEQPGLSEINRKLDKIMKALHIDE